MREIIRVERLGGRYGCSQCDWIFDNHASPEGDTVDEMKENYLRDRDAAFLAHSCKTVQRPMKP